MSVLYLRNDESADSEEDDRWDDSDLQEAYDRATQLTKKRLNEISEKSTSSPKKTTAEPIWTVGMRCRVVYTDGIEYEASIEKVLDNGHYIIRYIGYNNTQEIQLNEIMESHGNKARKLQEQEALLSLQQNDITEVDEMEQSSVNHVNKQFKPVHPRIPPAMRNAFEGIDFGEGSFPPPPPLPPNAFPPNGDASCESEAMSAMLMSWYMSGYYTGYYQGMKHSKKK